MAHPIIEKLSKMEVLNLYHQGDLRHPIPGKLIRLKKQPPILAIRRIGIEYVDRAAEQFHKMTSQLLASAEPRRARKPGHVRITDILQRNGNESIASNTEKYCFMAPRFKLQWNKYHEVLIRPRWPREKIWAGPPSERWNVSPLNQI